MPRDDSPDALAFRIFWGCRHWSAALLAGVIFLAWPVATGAAVLVIGDDRGGGVVERVALIERYRRSGTQIEIRGAYCLSACTMYLGLANTCVAPNTVFGFHGPSSPLYGIALSTTAFERWSHVMANHYPEPIKGWFLRQGRHRTVGFHRYSGADLIKMGMARCTDL